MKKFQKSRHARLAAMALAVGVFVSLAGVGYAAGLVPFAHTSPTAAQYPTSKVTICHHTHSQKNPFVTITVSEHALPAHLKHGDTVGPCPTKGTTGATGAVGPVIIAKAAHGKRNAKGHHKGSDLHATVKSHGKGHAYGHSSTHGRGNSQGHGQANGHSSTNGHGNAHGNNGQGHGHDKSQTHGNGQGHGQGHGSSGTHGNSGGNGKGNKH